MEREREREEREKTPQERQLCKNILKAHHHTIQCFTSIVFTDSLSAVLLQYYFFDFQFPTFSIAIPSSMSQIAF